VIGSLPGRPYSRIVRVDGGFDPETGKQFLVGWCAYEEWHEMLGWRRLIWIKL